jgi:hypothetical protein
VAILVFKLQTSTSILSISIDVQHSWAHVTRSSSARQPYSRKQLRVKLVHYDPSTGGTNQVRSSYALEGRDLERVQLVGLATL